MRISTLTTGRNIRGHVVYRGLGYVDLAPFFGGTRRVARPPPRPAGIRLREATTKDFPLILTLFDAYTRDSLGWTVRLSEVLPAMSAAHPGFLGRYRVLLRDGRAVGYLRTGLDDVLMEEVIVPRAADFRAAVALMERRAAGGFATTTWITCRKDQARFRRLGYDIDGPISSTTMALSLVPGLRTRDLPRLFGGTDGRFAHYATEDF